MAADPNQLAEPLRTAVLAVLDEAGGRVRVVSALRTQDEQIALRRQNCGGTDFDIWNKPADQCKPTTAKPGESQHERGLAVDFGGDLTLAAQLGAKHGLVRTVPGEPWHFEHTGGAKASATVGAGAAGIDPVSVQLSGLDVLGNRIRQYASVPEATLAVLNKIVDPGTWLRVAGVIGGGALVLTGLLLISRDVAPGAAGAALGATPAGRVTAGRAAGRSAVNPATPIP